MLKLPRAKVLIWSVLLIAGCCYVTRFSFDSSTWFLPLG